MKKLIFLLLALAACLVLVACRPNTAPSDDIPAAERLYLSGTVGDVVHGTQIIRADRLSGQSNEVKCAIKIVDAIKEMTGVEIAINTDYTGDYGTPEMPSRS